MSRHQCVCAWPCEHRPRYTRADLVRAILGQQWAVAIALYNPRGNSKETIPHRQMENYGGDWVQMSAEDLASLPSPDDVVTAMEQT